jgi:hypothetical protein
VDDVDIDAFVRDVLLSESRTAPVAVLAPLEEGTHLVSPNELADALLGLAHVYYIERHQTTFRLTDSLGDKRLSVYWGALRIYRPGFSCADRPEDHDLLVRDRVIDPIMRTELFGRLARLASLRVTMPAGVEERRNPPALQQPAALLVVEEPPAPTGVINSPIATPVTSSPVIQPAWPASLLDLAPQVAGLAAAVASLVESNRALTDEIARLRTTNAVRAGNAAAVERRLGGLEQQLERHFAPPVESTDGESATDIADDEVTDEGDGVVLTDVLQQAAVTHADALLILESAERSAAESPYEDPERVAVILDAMAAVARRRQEVALGMSLREAYRELGIDYLGGVSSTTSRRDMQQYHVAGPQGQRYECEEHIVLGGTYDPRRCLRIYFTSRAPVGCDLGDLAVPVVVHRHIITSGGEQGMHRVRRVTHDLVSALPDPDTLGKHEHRPSPGVTCRVLIPRQRIRGQRIVVVKPGHQHRPVRDMGAPRGAVCLSRYPLHLARRLSMTVPRSRRRVVRGTPQDRDAVAEHGTPFLQQRIPFVQHHHPRPVDRLSCQRCRGDRTGHLQPPPVRLDVPIRPVGGARQDEVPHAAS